MNKTTKPFIPPIGMSKFLDTIAKKTFGRTRTEAIAKGICIDCGKPAADLFSDELSRKEYSINGFCSVCQKKFLKNTT